MLLPVLGNPEEFTIKDFAVTVRELIGSSSPLKNLPKTKDDPSRRRPNIERAEAVLGWRPKWRVKDGLRKTIEYFREELTRTGEVEPIGPPE